MAAADDEGKTREQLQAEGWRFSGGSAVADGAGHAAPAANRRRADHFYGSAGAAADETDGERLVGLVLRNGSRAAEEVVDTMAVDGRAVVQAKGCKALAILAEKDAGRAVALGLGATFAVTQAMEGLRADAELQAAACSALANLCLGEGAAEVLEGGGVDAVLAAMAAHPAHAAVQAKACLALANLGYTDQGEAEALAKGAVGAIAAALRAHGEDGQVVEEACDALGNLAAQPAGLRALLAEGGAQLVAAARDAHPGIEAAATLAAELIQPSDP